MRGAWVLVVLAGCGSSTSTTAPANASPPSAERARHDQLCGQARALYALGCPPFDRLDASLLAGECGVVNSFYISGMDSCLAETTCPAFGACIHRVKKEGAPYRGPTRACALPAEHPDLSFPAGVSQAEVAASYGANDTTFADSPSSREKPIEVCGLAAQATYLLRVTCKDGSRPFADRDAAEDSRAGNVGPGGRCGRIIDHYIAPCPEQAYDVFIDAYRCPT